MGVLLTFAWVRSGNALDEFYEVVYGASVGPSDHQALIEIWILRGFSSADTKSRLDLAFIDPVATFNSSHGQYRTLSHLHRCYEGQGWWWEAESLQFPFFACELVFFSSSGKGLF